MDGLKAHVGGAGEAKKPLPPPKNLFICSAYFFALLDARNAAIVYEQLRPFRNENGSLPTDLAIDKKVMLALKDYKLKIADNEARRFYNKFLDTLIEGENIYLQFDTPQEWISVYMPAYKEIVGHLNEGTPLEEAISTVNQKYVDMQVKEASAKIQAENLKNRRPSEPQPEGFVDDHNLDVYLTDNVEDKKNFSSSTDS